MARWFLGCELVGCETPWWRDDRTDFLVQMASLVYERENCITEERLNVGITKGERSFYSAEFRKVLKTGKCAN